jgi:putative transposase
MGKELDDFIKTSGKSAEIKRALAVKQDLLGKPRPQIAEFLDVHPSFVSKWRLIYNEYGVEGLYSQHKGGSPRAFLQEEELKLVYAHIRSHKLFGPDELIAYLKDKYEVRFKSMQSYYEILHAAEMSWHKSQKSNPRKDEEKVLAKRKELKKNQIEAKSDKKRGNSRIFSR